MIALCPRHNVAGPVRKGCVWRGCSRRITSERLTRQRKAIMPFADLALFLCMHRFWRWRWRAWLSCWTRTCQRTPASSGPTSSGACARKQDVVVTLLNIEPCSPPPAIVEPAPCTRCNSATSSPSLLRSACELERHRACTPDAELECFKLCHHASLAPPPCAAS